MSIICLHVNLTLAYNFRIYVLGTPQAHTHTHTHTQLECDLHIHLSLCCVITVFGSVEILQLSVAFQLLETAPVSGGREHSVQLLTR